MNVKGEVLLNFLTKIKLRNETKTYPEQNFFTIYSQFKKLGFSTHFQLNTGLKNSRQQFLGPSSSAG